MSAWLPARSPPAAPRHAARSAGGRQGAPHRAQGADVVGRDVAGLEVLVVEKDGGEVLAGAPFVARAGAASLPFADASFDAVVS